MFLRLGLILLFIFPSFTLAKNEVAQVTLVKGKVTKLEPGRKKANDVKKGDKIVEDTSIVTGDKSIVRLKFNNGNSIVLGKNGKFVIQEVPEDAEGSNFINLLLGKMKTKVLKERLKDPKKPKLIIKTRTAALGVRGTEFFTVYNPKNQVTSLVTLEGEVAMKKVVKKRGIVEESEVENKKSSTEKFEELSEDLAKEDVVLVKKGRYSGVTSNFVKASQPVKISPIQYLALKKNENLEDSATKNADKAFSKKEIEKAAKEINKVDSKDPKLEGSFNEKTGDFAPKAGGYVDPVTGIYIQPSKNARYDSSLDTYLPSDAVGTIDANGNYVAPAGLILTAEKGFVAETEESKKTQKQLAQLNSAIATAIPIDEKEDKAIEEKVNKMAKAQVKKTRWTKAQEFRLVFGGSSYLTDVDLNDNESLENNEVDSSAGNTFSLEWNQTWTKSFETELFISRSKYELYKDNNLFEQRSEDIMTASISARYWPSSWFGFRAGAELSEWLVPYVREFGATDRLDVERMDAPRIVFGPEFRFLDNSWFRVELGINALFITSSDTDTQDGNNRIDLEMDGGVGFRAKLKIDFKVLNSIYLSGFLRFQEFNTNVNQNDPFSLNNNGTRDVLMERGALGLTLTYVL